MQDNELFTAMKAVLTAGFAGIADARLAGLEIDQRYQPTQQGTPTAKYVTFFIVNDLFVGSPQLSQVYDPDTGIFTTTQKQAVETTFQIGAGAIVDPYEDNPLTAKDLVRYAAMILQGQGAIQQFLALGAGVQKVKQIRNPQFLDDRDRFETDPSFDFTLSHEQVIIKTDPSVTTTELIIKSI